MFVYVSVLCKDVQQCADHGGDVWFAYRHSKKVSREHITGCEFVPVSAIIEQFAYQIDLRDVFRAAARSEIVGAVG